MFDPEYLSYKHKNTYGRRHDDMSAPKSRYLIALVVALLLSTAVFTWLNDAQAQAYGAVGVGGPPISETIIVWPRQGNTQFISRSGRPNQHIFYQDGSSGYGYGGYGGYPDPTVSNFAYGLQAFAPLFQRQPAAPVAPVMPGYAYPGGSRQLAKDMKEAQAAQPYGWMIDPRIEKALRDAQISEVDTSDIEGW